MALCRAPLEHNEIMTVRVNVEPDLFGWACERSGIAREDLSRRFPKLAAWETGETQPTLKQLEGFAQVTHTPIGFLLLTRPPAEEVPLPDFRTMGDVAIARPSADLLDVVYDCEQRQEWYRDFAQTNHEEPVRHVGSVELTDDVVEVAAQMRQTLAFAVDERGPTWSDALRHLVENAEESGVLVMVSGVVGSNTHRKLNPQEFRGFALADSLAPLVFINGADTKAAQIFTLAHELAHIWLGQSALSDVDLGATSSNATERWCNEVAAEFLVPLASVRERQDVGTVTEAELSRLAREFKVSTLVVLRRLHDTGRLSWRDYRAAYGAELSRVMGLVAEGGGGNFYSTQPVRVSKRFARALIASTLEGQTLHRDAFRMLGFKKVSTFHELGQKLGVL
jgi:Zn-dependent peptidase ImmA (M78 family)